MLAHSTLPALDTGLDWFVEASLAGTTAVVSVAKQNCGTEAGASIKATIHSEALKQSALGVKAALELGSLGGNAPSLDELFVQRCAAAPPAYTKLFRDTFARADSTTLGNADFPANSTWIGSSPNAAIVSGALRVQQLSSAFMPLATVPGNRLRIRAAVMATGPAFWANINYNSSGTPQGDDSAEPGFSVHGPLSNAVYTRVFLATGPEREHDGITIASNVYYFAELDRDDRAAVITLRSGSFTGPVLAVDYENGLTDAQNTGQWMRVHTNDNASNNTTNIDELDVDKYVVP